MNKRQSKLHKKRLLTSDRPHKKAIGGEIANAITAVVQYTANGLNNIAAMNHQKFMKEQADRMNDYKREVEDRNMSVQNGQAMLEATNTRLQEGQQMAAATQAKQNAMWKNPQQSQVQQIATPNPTPNKFLWGGGFGGTNFGGMDMTFGSGFGSRNMFQQSSPTLLQASQLKSPQIDIPITQQTWSNPIYAQQQLNNVQDVTNSFQNFGSQAAPLVGGLMSRLKKNNTGNTGGSTTGQDLSNDQKPDAPSAQGNGIAGAATAAALSLDGALGSVIGGDYHTDAGDVINKLPGLGLVGGLINRAFGIQTNEAEVQRVKNDSSYLNNTASSMGAATSFDDKVLNGPKAINFNVKAYKGGWFSGGKAGRKNQELKDQLIAENQFAKRSASNAIGNIANNQYSNLMANYAAFGGPLEYDLNNAHMTSLYRKANDSRLTTMPNSFMTNKSQVPTFANGGNLMTHGADWSNGLIYIDNGGSHETNPQDGVPMGIAPDGQPNLVEEGEVVYNRYVFSDRLKVPEDLRKLYHLQKGATFADAAKLVSKESEERPNDPISKAGLNDSMNILKDAQEEIREEKKVKQAKREAKKQADAQMAMGINPMQQQMMLQQPQMPDQLSQEQMAAQELTQQGNGAFACGGHLHGDGDYIVRNADGSIDYDKSVFGLNEVTVTAKAKKKDPLLNDMFIQPLSVGEMSLPQQQVLIRDAIQKQEMARRKRDYLLGKSSDWFKCEGHLHGDGGKTKKAKALATWLRYAPIAGNLIGLGLSYLPTDYSNAEKVETAARTANDYGRVSFNPLGNYLTFRPEDINYVTNQLRAAEEATARNILNTAGGNQGVAMAGLLANGYNSQIAQGNALHNAFLGNRDQEQKVETFNRETNLANSQGFLEAGKANQAAEIQSNAQRIGAIETAAKMRQLIDDNRDQSRAANLTGLFNSIGDIGKENMAFNMVNSNRSEYYGIKPNGQVYFKQGAFNTDGTLKQEAIDDMKEATKACGGMLTMRKSKKRRR